MQRSANLLRFFVANSSPLTAGEGGRRPGEGRSLQAANLAANMLKIVVLLMGEDGGFWCLKIVCTSIPVFFCPRTGCDLSCPDGLA